MTVAVRNCRLGVTLVEDALSALVVARASGDPRSVRAAEHELVQANLPKAAAVARRYQHRGVEFDDLEQLARLGLLKAVQRWRPDQAGGGFLNFAMPTMVGEVKRYFRDHGSSIRMPRRLMEIKLGSRPFLDQLEQQLSRTPRAEELAAAVGVPLAEFRSQEQAALACRPASLDGPGAEHVVRNLLHPTAESELERVEQRLMLKTAIQVLDVREQLVLQRYFFADLTQSHIGAELNIQQMHVSRIIKKLLATLREQLAS